jgi:predicted acetyltransferase
MPAEAIVRLVLASRERRLEFETMLDEWKANNPKEAYGSSHALALTDVDGYFAYLEGLREGRGPVPGLVPTDTFWIEERGMLAGTVSVRYALSPILMQRGGNIGYSVRPSARGRELAQRGLRLALDILYERGTPEALLTCKTTNAASAHIIEKAGRRIDDTTLDDGAVERRYWVPTTLSSRAQRIQ